MTEKEKSLAEYILDYHKRMKLPPLSEMPDGIWDQPLPGEWRIICNCKEKMGLTIASGKGLPHVAPPGYALVFYNGELVANLDVVNGKGGWMLVEGPVSRETFIKALEGDK